MYHGFIQRGVALEFLPRKLENFYSLIVMHGAVAVPHNKLLPPTKNPV